MAHHAHIDDQNVVDQVLVITTDELANGSHGDPSRWLKCSYNTHGGVHYEPNVYPPTPSADQSKALRKNFPGVGHIYDPAADAFHAPQPFPSWTLDPDTFLWEAPEPMPAPEPGKQWHWDEDSQQWLDS